MVDNINKNDINNTKLYILTNIIILIDFAYENF